MLMNELITVGRHLFGDDERELMASSSVGRKRQKLSQDSKTLADIEVVIAVAWEHLNTGHWKDVDHSWRFFYAYASLMKAKVAFDENDFNASLKAIDMGILMGAPILENCMPNLAQSIHSKLTEDTSFPKEILKVPDDHHHENIPKLPPHIRRQHEELKRATSLSVTDFMLNYFKPQKPCIIEGLVKSWPAFEKWPDLSYLRKQCGLRTVPVEVGHRYTDSDWGQRLMRVSEFLDEYVIKEANPSKRGYLAQHHLLDQIPELRKDIIIPDFCFVDGENDNSDEEINVELNAWFGGQTVSPLHQDPKDNILCQVTGTKFVYLFDPAETELLYPFDSLISNTSQIDLLDVDLNKFPRFSEAKSGRWGLLKPGDALFLPKQWWHFVTSLSAWSCSVSFWF